MEIALFHIGVAQSIFAALFLLFKKPHVIADKILSIWLLNISLLFILNLLKANAHIQADIWPISVNISLNLPPFLYLYSKYITIPLKRFSYKDLLNFTPTVISLIIIIAYYDTNIKSLTDLSSHYNDLITPRTITGFLLMSNVLFYITRTIIRIIKYKKQIGNFYSYDSSGINLLWLQIVVISYIIFFVLMIVMSALQFNTYIHHIEYFRSGALIFYVYVLSFGGLKQQQLISDEKSVRLNDSVNAHKLNEDRYTKSGLKENQAEEYLQTLIDHMNKSEAWKDTELSIGKLSDATEIPKHYITQTLNNFLDKNFYTFVNEYRTEYAKQLMQSPKYKDWSILAIAFESGFNSKSAFNNFFKKYTNKTPSEFKKSIS